VYLIQTPKHDCNRYYGLHWQANVDRHIHLGILLVPKWSQVNYLPAKTATLRSLNDEADSSLKVPMQVNNNIREFLCILLSKIHS